MPSIRTGPSLAEIIIGGLLSIILGALLAAIYLTLQPVKMVKVLPKEPDPGLVYFVEGQKDFESSRRWMFKREVFLQGQAVELTEGELNFWVESIYPPLPALKPGEAPAGVVALGTPQFKIEDGRLLVATVCRVSLYGLVREIVAQSTGGFAQVDGRFVFVPEEVVLGRFPAGRLGPVGHWVFRRIAGAYEAPEDIVAAWARVSEIRVEQDRLVIAGS